MKKYYIILFCIQALVALGAIPAGLAYISDPSGSSLGVSTDLLSKSPLKDFMIPGLFLFIVHGIGNIAGAILTLTGKPLAGRTGMILGAVLCLWIVIQLWWIGLNSFMQPLFFGIGLFEVLLGSTILKKSKAGL